MRLARLWERSRMRHDSNTGGLGAKWACSHMFIARALSVKCDSVAHIKRLHV